MPVNDRITPSTDRPNMVVGKFEVHWTDGRAITTVDEAETVAIVPERIEYSNEAPKIRQAMREIETARFGGLEDRLLELVWLRASQINGSRSLSGQANAAFAGSDDEQRLASLPAWRDVPFYSERERAALAWSEAVTRFADYGVPDDVFSQAHKQFTDQELIYLTVSVISLNAWNRLNTAYRTPAKETGPARNVGSVAEVQAIAQ